MAKKESTFFNMTITLVIVTLVASASLGFVYEITKEPIAQAKLEKQIKAIQSVVPTYTNNPIEEEYALLASDGSELQAFPAYEDESLVGTAIRTFSPRGYSGEIWLMVGLGPEGKVLNVEVLEHKETPGLGSKMSDEKFKGQFKEKDLESWENLVTKDGGEVDALTGATISSRAFCEAVQLAYDAYKEGGRND